MKSPPSLTGRLVLLVICLTTATLIFISTSSSFIFVLAGTTTTHRRNDDDNDPEVRSSLSQQQYHQQSSSRNNDPIRDGRLLLYSDDTEQDVTFYFRLAYPPYNRKSLDKLLLLPPKQKQQQQQQQQPMNEKMDTDLEDDTTVVIKMAEEKAVASKEIVVVDLNKNNSVKSSNNRDMMAANVSNVSIDADDDTITNNDDQGTDIVERSMVENVDILLSDYDDDDERNGTVNDNVSLSSLLSSLLDSQQLEVDYLTTTTNVDGTTIQQEEQHGIIMQSNDIMIDVFLDSNDDIQLEIIIDDDDDMSSSDTIVSYQSVHGLDGAPPKLVRLDESVEILFDETLDFGTDGLLSTIQDHVGQDETTTASTLILSTTSFDELDVEEADRLSTTMQHVGQEEDITSTTIHSSSSTTSTISSSTTTTTSNANANRQFVDGLDDLPKLFESVEVPDELDVGADGSSMQEVLVGQGIKILWKHVKNVSGGISSRFGWNKGITILWKHVKNVSGGISSRFGWNKLGGSGSITADSIWRDGRSVRELEEEDNMSFLDSLLLNDLTNDRAEKTTSESRWLKMKLESISLVKSPEAMKVWNYAKRKLVQTRQLLDKIVKLFEGDEDEDDYYDEKNDSFLKSRLLSK